MKELNYFIVDVFTDRPFGGNPLAVFPEGDGLSTELMQNIANELNLSETTFVCAPTSAQGDCTVRIFTPQRELPMAGHPTIGTACVILRHNVLAPRNDRFLMFDEGVGPVRVDFTYGTNPPTGLTMCQPLPEFVRELDRNIAAKAVSLETSDLDPDLPVEIVSCGVPYMLVPVTSEEAVARAAIRTDVLDDACAELDCREAFVFSRDPSSGADVHCRMFAPRFGVPEDPATGSAHGPLGSYFFKHGLLEGGRLVSEQGLELGRPSRIDVRIEGKGDTITGVFVGGECAEVGSGVIRCVE
ncbi:MAG: phenazine biosynthesis protein PhzF [Verrucomicrobiales bacterium]|nr:phenazine biosynthesis protein PhzF [Verrucomicrobiales bacterium]